MTEGDAPSRRAYHGSFIHDSYLYIHGGHDIREGNTDSLWRIDINTKNKEPIWEELAFIRRNYPGPIAYHTTTVKDDQAFLIGGSKLGVDSMKDYILNLKSFEWTALSRNDPNAPISIDEHSATLVGDQIYIFGGNISGFKNDQIFVFDTQTYKWHVPKQSNGP
jgi:hypothetical protein